MSIVQLRAKIEINKVNPYVAIGEEAMTRIRAGWRKPLPVIIRINGLPKAGWKINLMPVGDGSFYLYLNGVIRTESATKVGDLVSIEIEEDENYKNGPIHPVPDWFSTALDQNKKAMISWNRLIPSRQKEVLRYFAKLKTPEAIDRNLVRAIGVLSGGKERFLGRYWTE